MISEVAARDGYRPECSNEESAPATKSLGKKGSTHRTLHKGTSSGETSMAEKQEKTYEEATGLENGDDPTRDVCPRRWIVR